MRISILIFLFLPFALFANDEIIVHLATKESLAPLFISPIKAAGSGFEQNYISSLEKVIHFDFNNNGKTEVVAATQRGAGKLEIEIKQQTLNAKWITDRVKSIEGIALSGSLAKDRLILHRLHDTLFEAHFGVKGIAATHLLYTLRHRKGERSSDWISDVWIADYDGGNSRQLTHDSSICVTPTFVPHQEGLAQNFLYVSYKIGQPKIYTAALNETSLKRVTLLKGNQLMPAISPTLDKIAFISDVTGNPDLFIQDYSTEMGTLGKPRQIFCAPGAAQGTPSFSPDGKRIAFVSNKDGTPRIYILDIPKAGASVKNLKAQMISKKNRDNTSPAWSPDGKKIAYSSLTAGTRQIWIYDCQTKEERQITDGGGHKENPAWAPNSEHLVFNSTSAATADLYLIHLNQKRAVKITSGPGEKRFPSWENFIK